MFCVVFKQDVGVVVYGCGFVDLFGLEWSVMFLKIEDYVLIGDCEIVVLVLCDGFIDWLCWLRFDLGVCFVVLFGILDNG